MGVVLVSADMLVSSRIMIAARRADVPLTLALSPADLNDRLTAETRLVLVDLSQAGSMIGDVVAAVRARSPQARMIAFGPHVAEGLLASAREAGCDVVMSNGEFYRETNELLRRHTAPGS